MSEHPPPILFFQLARLQKRRVEDLQRLCCLVRPISEDMTIKLGASWKTDFQECQDWVRGDGKTASLDEIDKWYNEAHQRVR